MSDLADSIGVERDGLRDMLERVAVERETAPEAEHDARYANAAASIRRIAAIIDRVDDATLVGIAMISQASNGLPSELITAAVRYWLRASLVWQCGRILRGVRCPDREGVQAAAAMMVPARCIIVPSFDRR